MCFYLTEVVCTKRKTKKSDIFHVSASLISDFREKITVCDKKRKLHRTGVVNSEIVLSRRSRESNGATGIEREEWSETADPDCYFVGLGDC